MLLSLELSTSLLVCVLPLIIFFLVTNKCKPFFTTLCSSSNSPNELPRSYPIIGSIFAMLANRHRRVQWTSDAINISPTSTFILHRPFGLRAVLTANPLNVRHILNTRFINYQKGESGRKTYSDFLGDGIFNADGETWKFQRQVASHIFNTKSLRKFIEHVVDVELNHRLIPILAVASENTTTVLDFQDILQRFAFDNICKIAFGYDPGYLQLSLPEVSFPAAFEAAVRVSSGRLAAAHPLVWKIKRLLNVGSEKLLRDAVEEVRGFAKKIIKEKKEELKEKKSQELESADMLSRFLGSGHSDEDFVADIVISFILAGRDTTSAALTWFFWLISQHPDVESEILKEIREKSEEPVYEEVKDMAYTHASLCETMRLYPPVPMDGKAAAEDDVLPDGTVVKRGMIVAYHPYAMGRSEKLWGEDWAEFRPERWLQKETAEEKWSFVARDLYTYPVFQAGPRVCLGKEMAFLQMKRVVAGVLRRFRVVPALEEGAEPVFISYMTSKMRDGFPVRIEKRAENV